MKFTKFKIYGFNQNKWLCAAIPALLLHCSTGSVYCWSLFSETIVDYIGGGVTKSTIEWAFSLAVFFLGISAAFLGPFVERDIHRASLVSTICFTVGMAGTGFFIYQKSVLGIFICYGVIMGIGLGTGYLSPVKTLMLWFRDQKGLATGLAITGFCLAKAIASPVMERLQSSVGIVNMFYILAAVYFVMMFIGHLLLRKPGDWVEPPRKDSTPLLSILKNRAFIGIWIMFFLNITCGLALISQEKSIAKAIGLAAAIGLISSGTAISNAAGRFVLSTISDKMKNRNSIYKFIFLSSITASAITAGTNGIVNSYALIVVPLLLFINMGYGGGFSNVPTLLSDHFGMRSISRIHGLVLSAWALAGLAGNQLASFIVEKTGTFYVDEFGNRINPEGYQNLMLVLLVLFLIAAIVCFVVIPKGNYKEQMQLNFDGNSAK